MEIQSIGNNFVYGDQTVTGRVTSQGVSSAAGASAHAAVSRDYWSRGMFLPRDQNLTGVILADYQDDFALVDKRASAIVTLTPNVALSSGTFADVFRDDTNTIDWNAATSPYPIVIEVDVSANPLLALRSGSWSVAITFRNQVVADLPTNVKVEFWDGSAYVTQFNAVPTYISAGQVWCDLQRTSPAPSNNLQKVKITLSGSNPVSNTVRIQRVMAYHSTGTWDPWHLHVGGGTMFGSVLFSPTATLDIGSSALMPRDVYVGRNLQFDGDSVLTRDAANILALKNSTNAQEFRNYGTEITAGTRYSRLAIKHAVTTLSGVNGASVTATNLIPAKANVLGVNTVVTTGLGTGGGTTGYTVGDGSDADRWGSVTGTVAGTDTDQSDATANPTGWFNAANSVVLTALGGNFNGTGVVVVDVAYTMTEAD